MISVLRPGPFQLLTQKLDAAVAADPSLAPARARLLLPLEVLDALAGDAVDALADDVLAGSRVRLLLVAGGAHAIPQGASSALQPASGGATLAPPPATGEDPGAFGPGLLHLGALVVVALAAGRVGASKPLAQQLVNTVFGLALASGLAEAIAAQGGAGLSDEQLRVLLASLADPEARSSAWSGVVGSFVVDPAERARWACLRELQELVLRQVTAAGVVSAEPDWDGALAAGITGVEPAQACPGAPVVLQGKPLVQDRRSLRAVFASFTGKPLAAGATIPGGTIACDVPAGATVGWVGYTDKKIFAAARALRVSLRKEWEAQNARPCLVDTPVLSEWIRDLADPPTPPITGANRFRGGLPAILEAAVSPARPSAGEALTLRWSSEGSTAVTLDPGGRRLETSGTLSIPAAAIPADGVFTLQAANSCGTTARTLSVVPRLKIERTWVTPAALVEGVAFTVHAAYAPAGAAASAFLTVGTERLEGTAANGEAVFQLDGSRAKDGFAATVELVAAGAKAPDDTQVVGPLKFGPAGFGRIVAVRPAVFSPDFARVSEADLRRAVRFAGAELGTSLEVIEPVWLEDEDLAITGPITAPDSPGVADLLERLERLAGKQPGLEDACWVALVPDPDAAVTSPNGVELSINSSRVAGQRLTALGLAVPAEAARSVAVATPRGLAQALRGLPEPKPVSTRLRIVGTIERRPRVVLEDVRQETRASGPGATQDTGVTLVALDGKGRELVPRQVKAVRAGFPLRFVCLLPISDDISAIELRAGRQVLLRLDRPPGQPALAEVSLAGATVGWSYRHTQGMAATTTVEMAQADGWCPVARVGTCDREVTLALGRLRRSGESPALRVAVTDGWTSAVAPAQEPPAMPARYVVARRAGPTSFWADTDSLGPPRWELGTAKFEGSSIELPPDARGVLTLSVTDDSGSFSDSRTIGGG